MRGELFQDAPPLDSLRVARNKSKTNKVVLRASAVSRVIIVLVEKLKASAGAFYYRSCCIKLWVACSNTFISFLVKSRIN
jgi:hypothetical protein